MPVIKIKECLNCGTDHEWLFSGATLKELRSIKQLTGMNAAAFAEAGDEGDPDALAALLYVLHKREKIVIPFDDIDLDLSNFKMDATEEELAEIKKQEEAANDPANPKLPSEENGQTPKVA
jgi:hypothetical protein